MNPNLRAEVSRLRGLVGPSEVAQWPTCLACMEASKLRHPGMGAIWIPVEGYNVEPEVFRHYQLVGGKGAVQVADVLYPPRERGSRGWFRVIATCHGKEATAEIDVPRWWGTAHVRAAIQALGFFGAETKPDHGLMTRIK